MTRAANGQREASGYVKRSFRLKMHHHDKAVRDRERTSCQRNDFNYLICWGNGSSPSDEIPNWQEGQDPIKLRVDMGHGKSRNPGVSQVPGHRPWLRLWPVNRVVCQG